MKSGFPVSGRQRPLFWCALFLSLGILANQYVFTGLIAFTVLGAILLYRSGQFRIKLLCVMSFFFILGWARMGTEFRYLTTGEKQLKPMYSGVIQFSGKIISVRKTKSKKYRYHLESLQIKNLKPGLEPSFGLFLYSRDSIACSVGNVLRISNGLLSAIGGPRNPGEFDFHRFYLFRRILGGAAGLVEQVRSRGVTVVPCLVVEEPLRRLLDDPGFLREPRLVESVDPRVLAGFSRGGLRRLAKSPFARAARGWPVVLENTRRMVASGCAIAGGSDAGNLAVFHGPGLQREAELLVAAGMTPRAALRACTLGGARLLGRASEQGTLGVGKRADLVVLDADPLDDIRNLRHVAAVVKGGALVDLDRLRARIAGTARAPLPSALLADFQNGAAFTSSGSRFHAVVETGPGPHSRAAVDALWQGARGFLRAQGMLASRPGASAGIGVQLHPYGLMAVDLERTPCLSAAVRGDGGTWALEVVTLDCGGGAYTRAFKAPPGWSRMCWDLRGLRPVGVPGSLPCDPSRVLALRFVTGRRRAGDFRLDLDDLRFEPRHPHVRTE